MVQTICESQKVLGPKQIWGPKIFWARNEFFKIKFETVKKVLGSKKICLNKIKGPIKLQVQKFLAQQIYWVRKNYGSEKILGLKNFGSQKLRPHKKCWYGLMLYGQMSPYQLASFKNGPRTLPLKFGQNHVSNSWYLPDIDKCCQDKFWLDKCHSDSILT